MVRGVLLLFARNCYITALSLKDVSKAITEKVITHSL